MNDMFQSQQPISEGFEIECTAAITTGEKCHARATWVWPWPSKNPGRYCDECLAKAKRRLEVALGSSTPI